MSIGIVSGIVLVALIFLITEKVRVDLTAIGIMVVLMITRILTPKEAVAGFSNPAVITVAAMFVLGRGMIRTGAVELIGKKVLTLSRGKPNLAMFIVLLIIGVASAFINNTPMVVLFIPIILSLACEYDLSPSKLLIPVSYASILGGTCTLVGTSTNIIVSDLSSMYGYGQLGMFELSPLGIPIAVIGIAFLYIAAPRLMPGHATPTCDLEDREDRRYLAELVVAEDSLLIGENLQQVFVKKYPSFELFELVRTHQIFYPDQDSATIQPGDLLLVKGSATDLVAVLQDKAAGLSHMAEGLSFLEGREGSLFVELILPPQSSLLGERLIDTELYLDPEIQIIAVKRRRIHYSEQRIENLKLRVGDIILIRCPEREIAHLRDGPDFILAEDVHHEIIHKRKVPWAFLIFGAMIVAASTGLADIMVCAITAVLLMVITGCLSLRDAYRSVSGEVLVLIVGTIALGSAMEKSGAAEFYAKGFLGLFQGFGPIYVLGSIMALTSLLTHILSNNATAVLVLPVAISAALSLGVHPKPFVIAVCFGASACFATPIGYNTNLLVYGPGGYRFGDYLKLGIPLNLIVLIMGALFIPFLWPL